MAARSGQVGAHEPGEIASALILTTAVWSILAAGHGTSRWLGAEASLLVSFSAACWLIGWTHPHPDRRPGRAELVRSGLLGVLACTAGFALFPVWVAVTWHAGIALGLSPPLLAERVDPLSVTPAVAIASVALAPAFEEPLYRGRLLGALAPRVGAIPAIVASSLLFAAPHWRPWQVLGTFLGGLLLGGAMRFGRSLALCVGLHAGFNVAAIACGIPVVRHALPPFWALVTGAALLGVTLRLARGRSRAESCDVVAPMRAPR